MSREVMFKRLGTTKSEQKLVKFFHARCNGPQNFLKSDRCRCSLEGNTWTQLSIS